MNQGKPQLSEADQKALEAITKQIREKVERKLPIPIIGGAFGEIHGCEGIVEEFIDDKQGLKCKFYGCPLLYKGFPERKSIESLGLVKALLTKFAEEVVWRSRFVQLFLVLYAVFFRRKFIHALRIFTYLTRVLVLNNLIYTNLEKFCYPVQHFLAVAKDTVRKHWDVDPDSKMMINEDRDYIGKRELPMVILGTLYIIAMIIEFDNAYRFRWQDAMENLNKDNIKKDIRKELKRLFDIVISREKNDMMREKWKQLSTVTSLVFFISPTTRSYFTKLFLTINTENIKLDEADWYYSLNRPSYDVRGWNYADRLKEMKRIEKEKGIIRFNMQLETSTKGLNKPMSACSKKHPEADNNCEEMGCKYTKINHVHVCEICGFVTKIQKKDVPSA